MPESEYLIQRRNRECFGEKPEPEKKVLKPIAPKSKKSEVNHRKYKKIVTEMLAEDNRCELRTPACTGTAQGLHHTRRRGINLLNKKYLLRACNACNGFVEADPQYALDHGLSISVHKVVVAEYDKEVKAIIVK